MIPRKPVISSNLKSVGYDAVLRILAVEYRSGGIYHYQGVPEAVYRGLLAADSKGGYLRRAVTPYYAATKQASEQKEGKGS